MALAIRGDQQDKVHAYLEQEMGDPAMVSVAVRRKVGKTAWRQVGDPYTSNELDALGTPEAIVEAILSDKITGRGGYQLLAYHGKNEDGETVTQPVVTFEVLTDAGRPGSPKSEPVDVARDLSLQLRNMADSVTKQLESAHERGVTQSDKVLDVVVGAEARREALAEKSAGTTLSLSLALVREEMEHKITKLELERVQREASNHWMLAVVERMPPEAVGEIVGGVVLGAIELGRALLDRVSASGGATTRPLTGPRPKASEEPPEPEEPAGAPASEDPPPEP